MSKKQFLPVKITSYEHAEELAHDGSMFMRALREFGLWGAANQDKELKNNYRGDVFSGTCEVFSSTHDCPMAERFPEELKSVMKNIRLIDNGSAQYFKIFSMICMDYDGDRFLPLDKRMEQFGDTAVIFTDFSALLGRMGQYLINKYDPVSILCNRVEFFDFSRSRKMNPLFFKHCSQSYQKEMRIAVCQLQEARMPSYELKRDLSSITLKIGSIQDIVKVVPVSELTGASINLDASEYVWPHSNESKNPGVFGRVIDFTRRQMDQIEMENVSLVYAI